jgi:hypothetical protein
MLSFMADVGGSAQLDMRKRFRGNVTTTSKSASADPVADISL